MLIQHEDTIQNICEEMEAVAEPIVATAQRTRATEEDEDVDEPSILGILNED